MADTSSLTLNVYKKGDLKTAIASGDNAQGAVITKLVAGTVVVAGDYVATHTDPTGTLAESDPADVPGFTVPKQKAPAPTNLVVTPTADGATIAAGTTE